MEIAAPSQPTPFSDFNIARPAAKKSNFVELVKLHRIRLRFNLLNHRLPSGLVGSAWRGTLGQVLLRSNQDGPMPEHHHCARGCVFCQILKPKKRVTRNGREELIDAPRPMTIGARMLPDPRRRGSFHLNLALIGSAISYLPELLDAFATAGERGIGANQATFKLVEAEFEESLGTNRWRQISEIDPASLRLLTARYEIPVAQNFIKFEFDTPLRIVRNNRPRLNPARLTFKDVFSTASRRVTQLTNIYGGVRVEDDFKTLSRSADSVKLHLPKLHRIDHSRYSSRQKEKLKMDGLMGEFYLDANQIQHHWPYLWFAQWLNIGKGSVMGMGSYTTSHNTHQHCGRHGQLK